MLSYLITTMSFYVFKSAFSGHRVWLEVETTEAELQSLENDNFYYRV
jgi:hypothetical protein